MVGDDGKTYPFLVKSERRGDLRKDSKMVEISEVINRLLHKDPRGVDVVSFVFVRSVRAQSARISIIFHLFHLMSLKLYRKSLENQHSNTGTYRVVCLVRIAV